VDPPITEEILQEVQEVSQEWLRISGRRERRFTLGLFSPSYIQTTPLFLAQDSQGHTLAFVNLIPSYYPGEATIDLMRYRTGAPNGIMDYLFCQLFFHLQGQGYLRFNLGMAPLAGFQEKEQASLEERAIHFFLQRMEFLFSFSGLRQYKGKFADVWEPRYTVYLHALDLPRLALALPYVSEIRGGEWRSPSHAWSVEGHHFSSLRISSRTGP
jgi:phosphatidylglycerol lysyltransferase